MLKILNQYSYCRGAWLFMALTALGLEVVAFSFQHILGLKPCAFCIYERYMLFGIMGAGLVGAIAPQTLLRHIALAIWLYSAWKGIMLSWEHSKMQLHQPSFMTCHFKTSFPNWLMRFFVTPGSCFVRRRVFLTLEIPQWLVGIFMAYFIIALLVLVSQLFKQKNKTYSKSN